MSSIKTQERGIVSIMMTMVLIIIVSLIVLGMAQLSRREQRQSLDTQLSTQAFYAAESGLNDATTVLRDLVLSGASVPAKTDCQTGPVVYDFDTVIDAANDVSYTCLLITTVPGDLRATLTSTPSVFTLTPTGGDLNRLQFTWTKATGATTSYTNCPDTSDYYSFKPAAGSSANWNCPYAVLRIEILPGANVTRSAMIANTKVIFATPTNDGGFNTLLSGVPKVSTRFADCNNTNCTFKLFDVGGGSKYYVRVSAIYYDDAGDLSITGDDSSANPVTFQGSQAQIDVTGKAQDVLRRISATVDLTSVNQNSSLPAALISGDSICKREFAVEGSLQPDYGSSYAPSSCP